MLIRRLVLDGKLSLGQLTASGMSRMEQLRTEIARHGTASSRSIRWPRLLYGGEYNGTVRLDLSTATRRGCRWISRWMPYKSAGCLNDLAEVEQLQGPCVKAKINLSGTGAVPRPTRFTEKPDQGNLVLRARRRYLRRHGYLA